MKTEAQRMTWLVSIWRNRYGKLLRDYAALRTEHEKLVMKVASASILDDKK